MVMIVVGIMNYSWPKIQWVIFMCHRHSPPIPPSLVPPPPLLPYSPLPSLKMERVLLM